MAADIKNRYKYSDKERWVVIYPAYINSKKTIKEGRRIPVAKAVENPNFQEIKDVISTLGFEVNAENTKGYSRERSNEPGVRGRVRVHFQKDDGTPINEKYPTRDSLLLYCGEMIPKLKTRMDKSAKSHGDHHHAQSSSKKKKKK